MSKLKFKIIESDCMDKLEEKVNEWYSENPMISEIIDIKYSYRENSNNRNHEKYYYMISYREDLFK